MPWEPQPSPHSAPPCLRVHLSKRGGRGEVGRG
jgi:hypothetical protein